MSDGGYFLAAAALIALFYFGLAVLDAVTR